MRLNFDINRMVSIPRRLSRRRGFGIHSPFAFDFVRRVIAQPCSYYCYGQLNAMARNENITPAQLRLLFRVALFSSPKSYSLLGGDSPAVRTAITFARKDSKEVYDAGAGMCVMLQYPSLQQIDLLRRALQTESVVVALNARNYMEQVVQLWQELDCGMLFAGSSAAIIAPYSHLPHQRFDIWI